MRERFINRILNFDLAEAGKWDEIQANSEKAGRPMSLIDSLIAATAVFS